MVRIPYRLTLVAWAALGWRSLESREAIEDRIAELCVLLKCAPEDLTRTIRETTGKHVSDADDDKLSSLSTNELLSLRSALERELRCAVCHSPMVDFGAHGMTCPQCAATEDAALGCG